MMNGMYDDGGWDWGLMMFMPLIWIVLVGVVVWAVVRTTRHEIPQAAAGHRAGEPRESPRDVLDRRYASGEIDAEAYTSARNHLSNN